MSPQVFQILLSLTDGPLHGYAIITDVQTRTDNEIRLTASTLYDALARLLDQGLIKEVEGRESDSRRRSYTLTPVGRQAAEREADRLVRLVDMARAKRLVSPKGRR